MYVIEQYEESALSANLSNESSEAVEQPEPRVRRRQAIVLGISERP